MPFLRSFFQLAGDYGDIPPNTVFEVDEETAIALESRGLAERYRERKSAPETKMLAPAETKPVGPAENKAPDSRLFTLEETEDEQALRDEAARRSASLNARQRRAQR